MDIVILKIALVLLLICSIGLSAIAIKRARTGKDTYDLYKMIAMLMWIVTVIVALFYKSLPK